MKPAANGRVVLESGIEARVASHALFVHGDQPFMADEVQEGFARYGENYAVHWETTERLVACLGFCRWRHKTGRVEQLLRRLPVVGSHLIDYPQEAGVMLDGYTRN